MHSILSNINKGSSLPYISQGNSGNGNGQGHGHGHGHSFFGSKNGGRSRANPSGGFTLLQGHIQLMAMVPNLPENELSPRCSKMTTQEEVMGHSESRTKIAPLPQLEPTCPPITPRMMPSASKFKRVHLPSRNGFVPYSSTSGWQQKTSPRTVSELSLPPKPGKPIAMPSFGRHLPGTRRMSAGGMHQHHYSNALYQAATRHEMESGQAPPSSHSSHPQQAYMNSYGQAATTSSSPCLLPQYGNNMGYQMVNFVPQQQQQHQQQQTPQYEYEYILRSNNGSGDHHPMAPTLHPHQFQQQQQQQHQQHQQQQQIPPSYEIPYSGYQQKGFYGPQTYQFPYGYPAHFPHHQQGQSSPPAPYAAQSLPCFGTTCGPQQHQYQQPHPQGGMPPSMCSASMPQICVNNTQAQVQIQKSSSPSQLKLPLLPQEQLHDLPPLPKTRNTATAIIKPYKSKSIGKMKQEVAILVEDSGSSDDSSDLSDILEAIHKKYKKCRKRIISKTHLPLLVSPREEEEVESPPTTRRQAKKLQEDLKLSMLGPESNPTRIPSKPRVVHTALVGAGAGERECQENESCSTCKRCLSKLKPPAQHQSPEPKSKPKKKVNNNSNKFTPRKKQKSVVVALHDCFPSDSSVTDVDFSDMDSPTPRKSSLSNNGPPSYRKRKPRLDNILHKTKTKKGDSSEIFDVLHDLNPEEVRLFTCEYLTDLLSSEDWSNCHLGLETMVRLARHRPKVLLNYLGPILWYAFKHLQSAKSALCRAAIVTFTELFQRIGSALDNDLEKLLEKFVIKSLAPNMFIRAECDKALETMVNHCSLIKVLGAMESVSKKTTVRAACHRIARMTKQFVKVAGVDTCLKPMYAEKILPMLFSFMTEANNETRLAAKDALAMLMNHLQFEAAVTKHVTFDRNCSEVFKKLDKMRGRNRNRNLPGANRSYPVSHHRK